MDEISKNIVESLYSLTDMTAIVSDTDKILAAKGTRAKELVGKDISKELQKRIEERKAEVFNGEKATFALTKDGDGFLSQAVVPVVAGGDVLGAVILGDERRQIDLIRLKLSMLAADLIARQF